MQTLIKCLKPIDNASFGTFKAKIESFTLKPNL